MPGVFERVDYFRSSKVAGACLKPDKRWSSTDSSSRPLPRSWVRWAPTDRAVLIQESSRRWMPFRYGFPALPKPK
jgi:hypothetical protein